MKVLRLIFSLAINLIPQKFLEYLLHRTISAKADKLEAAESLRFLFRLDSLTYSLEGAKAIAYGNGLHTKHRHTNYHDFFVNRIGSDEKVVDIGCGIGALANSVANKSGATVLGIDISKENINIAKERYFHSNITFEVGNVLELATDQTFDVAILSNILEHLRGRDTFLLSLKKQLKIKRFLIRVPLFERDWRVPLKKELEIEYRLDKTHEIEYTQESFAEEVNKAGLKIVHYEVRWGEIWAELT